MNNQEKQNSSEKELKISHKELFGADHPAFKSGSTKAGEETLVAPELAKSNRSQLIPGGTGSTAPEKTNNSFASKFFRRLFKASVAAVVVLTPVFFYPIGDAVGFTKQALFCGLVLLVLASWAGKVISEGAVTWRKTHLIFISLALALVAVVSNVFSSSFWVSFLGEVGRYDFATIAIVSYVLLFLALVMNVGPVGARKLTYLVLGSIGLVSVVSALQLLGVFVFSPELTKVKTFTPIGSIFTLSLAVAMVLPILIEIFGSVRRKLFYAGLIGLALVFTAILLVTDFRVAYLALAIGFLVWIVMSVMRDQTFRGSGWSEQRNLIAPIMVFAVAVLFWVFPNSLGIGLGEKPVEIGPSTGASLRVMTAAWGENFLLGSGPESFPYVYGTHKAPELNQTNFWGVNFNNANSEIITWGATLGPLGLLALLAFSGLFGFLAIRSMRRNESLGGLGVFVAWVILLASKFFYSTPIALEIFFWILPAVFIAQASQDHSGWKLRKYSFQTGSLATLGLFVGAIVVLVVSVGGLYLTFNRWEAEKIVSSAFAKNSAETRDEALSQVGQAISRNSRVPRYYLAFSQIALAKISDIVSSSALSSQPRTEEEAALAQQELVRVQNIASQMFVALQEARQRDPQNVASLIAIAEIYRTVSPLVSGSSELATRIYEEATELEPTNPFLKTQRAHLYLVSQNFFVDQSVRVESNELVLAAKTELERAIALNPNYSNARYFLGFILDRQNDRVGALEQFERVLAFNPGHQALRVIVSNLRAGFPALGPPTPPSPQTPPVPLDEAQGRPAEGETEE